ncbi:hypothetical protein LzC2_39660 [Planctomycetes bacterium LzC2]|uniref:DUF1559 domain-containing protein n=1 Tax=Alienimonas chondri TaxID=2681879 RepID=A0ABX1VN54_9PLAN|nr:hypothetical protein [Alienimonas chondri]
MLAYVPADSQLVGVLEAKALLNDPTLTPIMALLRADDGPEAELRETFGLSFDDVERVAMYAPRLVQNGNGPPTPPVFVIRTVGEAPAPSVAGMADRSFESGMEERLPVKKVDARTLLFSPGGMNELTKPERSAVDLPLLKTVGGVFKNPSVARIYLNVEAIRPVVLQEIDRSVQTSDGADAMWMVPLLRPLVSNTDGVAMSLSMGGTGDVETVFLAESPDEASAERVAATTRAALTMVGNALDAAPALAGGGPQEQMGIAMAVGAARKVLDSASVEPDGPRTMLTATADSSAPVLVALLLPAIQQARAAARRAQSQNNLKQIALAMHNYHAAYKHFPPAVIVQNGVERSWRVELLPFLDQVDLYEKYDKTKPWDDPANAAVLAAMPSVFRHAADARTEPFTSYFAVLGEDDEVPSLWKPRGEWGQRNAGSGFRDIRDGTSNTLMVVDAKRPIPWTKPEDITLDLTEPVDPAQFGGFDRGGFQAAFGDGAVRFISEAVDATMLKSLFTRSGGEIVDVNFSQPRPQGRDVAAPPETKEAAPSPYDSEGVDYEQPGVRPRR